MTVQTRPETAELRRPSRRRLATEPFLWQLQWPRSGSPIDRSLIVSIRSYITRSRTVAESLPSILRPSSRIHVANEKRCASVPQLHGPGLSQEPLHQTSIDPINRISQVELISPCALPGQLPRC